MTLAILDEATARGFKSALGGWSTTINRGGGGYEQRNQNWVAPLRRYEFDLVDTERMQEIMGFVDDARGAYHEWLLKDWANYQLTDELILTAAGGETTAQIKQEFGSINVFSRNIYYVKTGTLSVTKNGISLTLTSDYTVDDAGLISFVTPLAYFDEIAVTCEFYIKVRFEQDLPGYIGVNGVDFGDARSLAVVEVR